MKELFDESDQDAGFPFAKDESLLLLLSYNTLLTRTSKYSNHGHGNLQKKAPHFKRLQGNPLWPLHCSKDVHVHVHVRWFRPWTVESKRHWFFCKREKELVLQMHIISIRGFYNNNKKTLISGCKPWEHPHSGVSKILIFPHACFPLMYSGKGTFPQEKKKREEREREMDKVERESVLWRVQFRQSMMSQSWAFC